MLVLAEPAAMERLRRDGGCRALADPGLVGHLPLVASPSSPGDGLDPEELAGTYERASGRDESVVVALCEVAAAGDLDRFVDRLEALGRWLAGRLQHDRTPFPLAAIVLASHEPITDLDRAALERILAVTGDARASTLDAEGDPPGLPVILPTAIPIYVMVHRGRLDHESRSWSCQEIWPAAVARLLASISLEPRRTAGLRAWRSVAVNYSEGDARDLEREVIEIVREAVDSVEESSEGEGPSAARSSEVETPPSDRVDDAGSPRHRLDKHGVGRAAHDPVPSFWSIEPSFEGGAGGGTSHAGDRLDLADGQPWQSRFTERGRRFISDRFKRVMSSIRSMIGPVSILRRVWRGIHQDSSRLRWYARGGFFTTAGRRELEELSRQKREWEGIRKFDAERDLRIRCARAEAAELDLARSHFVGLGWRIAAAASSGLFAAAIVGVATALLDPAWTITTGVASGAVAVATTLILLIAEAGAGARGRERLEREIVSAEQATSAAYRARLELAARGELLQRSTSWIQNCAKIRDAAKRLLALWDLSLEHASSLGIARSASGGSSLRRWANATMVQVAADLSYDSVAREVREQQPELLPSLQRDFESFWSESLRKIDRHEGGDVVVRRFGRELDAQLRRMRDRVRRELVAVVERWVGEDWAGTAAERVIDVFGTGTEFAGLSVSTRKASGARLRRVIRAHASAEPIAHRLGDSLERATLDGSSVSIAPGSLEPWGCTALAVEEIDVSLPAERRAPAAVFVEGPTPPTAATDRAEDRA